ncbi:MAG: hypothetical protein VX589_06635 [Myxococcota bacterium]|nr:hypothetical protein [Myxococcota bacterium]
MCKQLLASIAGLFLAISVSACGGSSDASGCDGIQDGAGQCYPRCTTDADCDAAAGLSCQPAPLRDGTQVNICRPGMAGIAANNGTNANNTPTPGTNTMNAGGAAATAANGTGTSTDAAPESDNASNESAPANSGTGTNTPPADGDMSDADNSNAGSNVDPNAPASVQACSAWLECVDMCPEAQGPNDAVAQQCFQQCTNGNPQGAQTYRTWVECARNNQCINQITNMIDQDCLFSACLTEVEACFGEIARPNGTGSCSDFVGCVNNCPQGDQTCRDNCIKATSEPSFGKYEAVITCLQDNMCFPNDMLDENCFEQNCSNLWDECIVDGQVFGNGTCADIHMCFWACDLMDNQCQEGCLELGTRESWSTFRDYLICASDAMCVDGDSCDAACGQERTACYEGGGAVNPPADNNMPAGGGMAPADGGGGDDMAPPAGGSNGD